MSREAVIEDETVKLFEAAGWLARKCVYAGRRGSPDHWFMKRARLVLVEFKKPGVDPDALQKREHKRLNEAGFKVYVVRSIEEGRALLDRLEGELARRA